MVITMQKKEKKKGHLGLLRQFLRGSFGYFIMAVIFAVLVSLSELINPKLIGITVDSVLGEESLSLPAPFVSLFESLGGAAYFREHLWVISLIIIAVAFLAVLCRYAFRMMNTKGAETLVETMRNQVFTHIERLPFSWHMKNNTGDIIQRCTSDIDMIKRFLSDQMTSMLRILLQIGLSMVFMFMIEPKLAIVALCSIPVIVIYSCIFRKFIAQGFEKCDENEGKLSAIVQENLTGVRVVRAFGREKFEKEKFDKQNTYYTGLWTRLMKLMTLFWTSGDLISGLQVLLIMVLGTVFCVRGSMTVGEFLTFVSYNSMLQWPVRMLGRIISEMSKAGISMERIAYIMDSETEHDKPDAVTPEMNRDIAFEHVSFSYDAMKPVDKKDENGEIERLPMVLKDVSFTVKAGSTIGILGGTGSGKSTLMYLLTRLYDLPAENGRITVGGVDIADMKAEWVRRNTAIVLQEPFLFSRSIADNIGIASKEQMTLSDIRVAAQIACLDETVENFAQGYNTFVGERGVTLSGGQKQRTAIARILTQGAPIMIFDDSLSAVDAETDAKIRSALRQNLGDSTVFLISHRISTLMHADQILVLDHGEAAEIGTHEELLAKGGIYKKIFDIQTAGVPELTEKEG
ncbi:MAG: ABC transporter ATP-binding protein/permease [Clostridia bacterium]|nr:ABC transporter ATP-binding protein/permease [Clostridia bacterium]